MKITSEFTKLTAEQKDAEIMELVRQYTPGITDVERKYIHEGISAVYHSVDATVTSDEVLQVIEGKLKADVDSLSVYSILSGIEQKLEFECDNFDILFDGIQNSDYSKVIPCVCRQLQLYKEKR
jgi:hypothetical protein